MICIHCYTLCKFCFRLNILWQQQKWSILSEVSILFNFMLCDPFELASNKYAYTGVWSSHWLEGHQMMMSCDFMYFRCRMSVQLSWVDVEECQIFVILLFTSDVINKIYICVEYSYRLATLLLIFRKLFTTWPLNFYTNTSINNFCCLYYNLF